MAARKILYSPGFGAGWSTWASGDDDQGGRELVKFMLTYQPLIEAVERGDDVGVKRIGGIINGRDDVENAHPAMRSFVAECEARFGVVPYLGGAFDLAVFTVPDGSRFRIEEYDGSESVVLDTGEGWL